MSKTKKAPEKLKASKQLTLDNLPPDTPVEESKKTITTIQEKKIIITEIGAITKEDELVLTVMFKLLPSKTAFSKIKSELSFNNQCINSCLIRIPQGPLSADELELPFVLDMRGLAAGSYNIRVEMYEPWSDGEKLSITQKQVNVQYVPKIKEHSLIKIPTVKSFGDTDLEVISESAKNIYREIKEAIRKESAAKRDQW